MFYNTTDKMEETRVTEKNAEFTYGVHAPSLLALVPDNQATILDQVTTEGIVYELDKVVMGSVRSLNEKFGLLRQGILYSFFWRNHPEKGIQFFVYMRTKKNNEGQLAQKLSLGAGGHIEPYDIAYYQNEELEPSAVINFSEACTNNYFRERGEELNGDHSETYPYNVPFLHGFVMDSKPEAGYVGNIHFGILAGCEYLAESEELEMLEPQNKAQGWFTPAELKAYVTGDTSIFEDSTAESIPFEPWSVLMIEKIEELVASIEANEKEIDDYFKNNPESQKTLDSLIENHSDPFTSVGEMRHEFFRTRQKLHDTLNGSLLSVPELVDALKDTKPELTEENKFPPTHLG